MNAQPVDDPVEDDTPSPVAWALRQAAVPLVPLLPDPKDPT